MLKVIKDLNDYSNQCVACGSMLNMYHIVMRSEWSPTTKSLTLCKDCLKEVQKQLKEQLDD